MIDDASGQTSAPDMPLVALLGCGYWGKNLARVLAELGALRAVCDADDVVAAEAASRHAVSAVDLDDLLADGSLAAVVIATPAATHAKLTRLALEADKHVFVEKPLALNTPDGQDLCALAAETGRTLMVGHLLQYHPAFLRLRSLVAEGVIGRLEYLYSNRLNFGRIRREEDILWSFAPHDISMILSLVGTDPESVTAVGSRFLHKTIADVTTTHLSFPGGEHAHVFVSWLHPYKEQKLIVIGDRGMLVFDDGEPWDRKLKLFHHRVEWRDGLPEPQKAPPEHVAVAPDEPLAVELRHFCESVQTGQRPRTDGIEGLRVLRVLEAASESMARMPAQAVWPAGAAPGEAEVFVHPSAYVDDGCEIGAGSRIWHFSHVLAGTRIGRHCTLGQNVMVGPNVTVGDWCKIQNNVSVYAGVMLEDGVFCGPSCVFTNVTHPRAEIDRKAEFSTTRVGRGATIGANATIVCGHDIGAYAMVAAGAVVTRDVPPHALVMGVPARQVGWVSHDGERLGDDLVCPRSGRRYVLRAGGGLEEATDG